VTPIPRIALIFPGQGAQFVGMGRDIYDAFPAARAVFNLADEALGFALSRLSFAGPDDALSQTANAQPAIVTLSLAILAAIQQSARPLIACFTAGHSLGEYSALAASGALSTTNAILLARRRGELMQQASTQFPGAMLAVIGLDEPFLKTICHETGVFIANYNSPNQIVLSGLVPQIEAAGRLAQEQGAHGVVPLRVSGPFHTPLMTQAAADLASAIDDISWTDPLLPVMANTTATPLRNVNDVKQELTVQLTHPLRWQEGIEALAARGIDTFVEIGPGRVLTGLIKRTCPNARTLSIGDAAGVDAYINGGLPA